MISSIPPNGLLFSTLNTRQQDQEEQIEEPTTALDSVYTSLNQNLQPKSDAPNLYSGLK